MTLMLFISAPLRHRSNLAKWDPALSLMNKGVFRPSGSGY